MTLHRYRVVVRIWPGGAYDTYHTDAATPAEAEYNVRGLLVGWLATHVQVVSVSLISAPFASAKRR